MAKQSTDVCLNTHMLINEYIKRTHSIKYMCHAYCKLFEHIDTRDRKCKKNGKQKKKYELKNNMTFMIGISPHSKLTEI